MARYYEKGIPFVSNWHKPGLDQEFTLTNLFTWGAELLYLMEKRRVEEFDDKTPIRYVKVAQVIIKVKTTSDSEPKYLMQYDSKSHQYQFIGGRMKDSDKTILNTMIREISEELSLNNLVFNENYTLKNLFSNHTLQNLSPTFGAFSEYQFNVFHMSLKVNNLKIGPSDRFVSVNEIRTGFTVDGIRVSNKADYEVFMEKLYEDLPLSLQSVLVDKNSNKINKKNKKKSTFDRLVRKYLSQGESETVEFKSSLRYDFHNQGVNKALEKVIIKVIASFMNSGGGILLIGVADNSEILGIENDLNSLTRKNKDGFAQQIVNLITSMIGVELCNFMKISFARLENHEVAIIKIEKSSNPVFIKDGENREFYIRAGNTSRMLNIEEVYKYIQLHW